MFEQQQVSVFAFWWFVQQALKYLWEAKLPTLFGYIMTTSICHCKSGILFVIEILFVTPYLWERFNQTYFEMMKHIERPYHVIWSGFSSILQPSCFGNIILDEVE